jgi:hypothetical protein
MVYQSAAGSRASLCHGVRAALTPRDSQDILRNRQILNSERPVSNPYEAPKQLTPIEQAPQKRLPRSFWWISIPATLLALGLGLIASFAIPAFATVFSSFGASLPRLSALFFQYANLLWAAFAISIVLWAWRWKTRRDTASSNTIQALFAVLLVLEIVLYPMLVDAMYRPMFDMGVSGGAPGGN